MSLDKQKILSELGSVMNQLQSADCGCMGKLFSNPNQTGQGHTMGSPLPTCGGCRRGCCHGHGYGHGMLNTGEPRPGNMNRPCMGHCNPPKLYADTYSYLNSNLMQPVVQEVYDDLKSITPANTVMNNPMANKMGFGQNVADNVGNTGMNMAQQHSIQGEGYMTSLSNMSGNINAVPMQSNQQPMNNMGGGMGPDIAKMIMGDSGLKQGNQQMQGQGNQLTAPMVIDAPQSPHGQVGVTPFNPATSHIYADMNQGGFTSNVNQFANLNRGQYQNPVTQYMTSPNSAGPAQNNTIQGNMLQNSGNVGNPATQMAVPNKRGYGQHTQGVMKFNEMFPGVTQGGDLGFDPMAIAIQMNPANQQKAAMDTMQKLMNGKSPMDKFSAQHAVSPATANIVQPPSVPVSQNPSAMNQQYTNQQAIPMQQLNDNSNATTTPTQPNAVPQQQQQVYSAMSGSNEQHVYQQHTEPHNQNVMNSQMEAPQPHVSEAELPATQQMNREPIFPVDTSRNPPFNYTMPQKHYEYNTLGQPVQKLPAQVYYEPEPDLPQTLSPQPIPTKSRNDQLKYSNVKSTVSKTSLFGNGNVGRRVSKSQLQHIYNQYKGSQSFTHQNLNSPVQAPTHSDGKLNIAQSNLNSQQQRSPVEKVGGDTIANNMSNNNQITEKVEQVIGQIGDVPCNNSHGDAEQTIKAMPTTPARHAKLRNGLQDMVYTSYPSSAAWSFH
ncbi:hypothetical protein evm_007328 [Chilo suppressalis]|nr:hypothetical protein evm_007328 [Chilo suppressalis]